MDSSDNPVAGWMLFLLFIVINSIFYGFGSAIQNLNENEIEDKAEQGDKKSKLLLHIMNAPGSLIQTVQFYHMLLSFLVGYVQLKSIMKTVSVSLSATATGVFFTENPGKIILCILVLFVDLILLATFGILVPKRICSRHAAASAYRMVHMVQAGIILAWPITKLMELLTNLTVRLFGIDPNHTEDDVTEDEIIDLVDEAHEQGIIQESEAEMIQNIMEFHDKSAKDIMTHRKNINALDDTTLLKDAIVYMSELFVDLILLATFGILVPKRICSRHAAASAYRMVHMVQAGIILAWPITKLMELLTNLTVRLFGIDPNHTEDDVTEDEIIDLVDEAHEQGIIQESEAEMIQNIMEFHDKSAKDIMTHRKNINALDDTTLLKDAIVYMSEHSNSRYPVYHEDIDNIVGFIHIKDAMEHQNRAEYEAKSLMQIPKLVRSVAYIPETRGIDSLFQAMQTKKIHIAIVVDEYGQTAGLVTMEDILEEIVGNIFDEYDESEEFIQPQFDESILMDGLTPLDDVEEVLGIDLGDHAFETLNGYLTSLLGHIPTAEDKEINANGYCFQILSVEDNIIQKIRVEKIQ